MYRPWASRPVNAGWGAMSSGSKSLMAVREHHQRSMSASTSRISMTRNRREMKERRQKTYGNSQVEMSNLSSLVHADPPPNLTESPVDAKTTLALTQPKFHSQSARTRFYWSAKVPRRHPWL